MYSRKSSKFSGEKKSSPSSCLKYFPLASLKPTFNVEPHPPFSFSIRRNISGYFFTYFDAISLVLSLEPSSIIITSSISLFFTLQNGVKTSSKVFSTLYAAIDTDKTLFSIVFPFAVKACSYLFKIYFLSLKTFFILNLPQQPLQVPSPACCNALLPFAQIRCSPRLQFHLPCLKLLL